VEECLQLTTYLSGRRIDNHDIVVPISHKGPCTLRAIDLGQINNRRRARAVCPDAARWLSNKDLHDIVVQVGDLALEAFGRERSR
jgi:hypothetical protein